MAYYYIDNLAYPGATDDGPAAAAVVKGIRANLSAVNDIRVSQTIDAMPWDNVRSRSPARICSCFPVSLSPRWIYSPYPTAYIEVFGRYDEVAWSYGATPPAAGTPAIRLYVTCGDIRTTDKPPAAMSEWTTFNTTGTENYFDLFANARGRKGWIAVYLWYVSYISDVAETSSTITQREMYGGLRVAALPTAGLYNPERAMKWGHSIAKGVPMWESPTRQVAKVETYGGANTVYPVPPVVAYEPDVADCYGDGNSIGYFTMGVMVLNSLYFGITPNSSAIPGLNACHINEPITEDITAALAAECRQMAGERVMMDKVDPGMLLDTGAQWVWWMPRILHRLANSLGSQVYNTLAFGTTHPYLAQGVIYSPPPSADRKGWRAIISLAATRMATTPLDNVGLNLRISGHQVGGALLGSAAVDVGFRALPTHSSERWYPIAQTVWGLAAKGPNWQYRGSLIDPSVAELSDLARAGGGDHQSIFHCELELPDTNLAYPLIIEVGGAREGTASSPSAGNTVDIVCVGFGLCAKEM